MFQATRIKCFFSTKSCPKKTTFRKQRPYRPLFNTFFTANSGGFLPESTIICVFWTKFTLSMFTSSKCKAGRKSPGCRRGIKGKPQKTKFQRVFWCFLETFGDLFFWIQISMAYDVCCVRTWIKVWLRTEPLKPVPTWHSAKTSETRNMVERYGGCSTWDHSADPETQKTTVNGMMWNAFTVKWRVLSQHM